MEAPQTMQPQFPTERALRLRSRILSFVFLFTLSLTFSAANAREGVVVARLDGTTHTVQAPMESDSIAFAVAGQTPQVRLVDVAQTTLPLTVIDFELDGFLPTRLEVFDLQGRVVRTLADGLWAEGSHRMAWYHENEAGEKLEEGVYVVRLTTNREPAGHLTMAR
jgi:hypothetical protein